MKLVSDTIILREFRDSDKDKLATLCNNKKIWNNVRDLLPYPYSEENAKEFIKACKEENPQVNFAIQYKDEFVGCIGLVKQSDVYKKSAEIGYWIGEPYWGLGIATKAVGLIVDYGFHTLGFIRIYSGVFDFNKASQKVLEKNGFALEGIFKKSVYKNGSIIDEYRYAITDIN
jgi:[ribosomal protein S5]-alanine N-acetyltransferase